MALARATLAQYEGMAITLNHKPETLNAKHSTLSMKGSRLS